MDLSAIVLSIPARVQIFCISRRLRAVQNDGGHDCREVALCAIPTIMLLKRAR
jgi:hypothetical protein